MADMDGILENKDKDYGIGIPVAHQNYFVKGADHLGWGMKDRLSRIFRPATGRTVMLAFDHGYIMGPTSGLERLDLNIVPLIKYADSLMCTRGSLRAVVPPTFNKGICLRYSAGSSILTELNNECVLDPEEAVRVNASAMAVMVAMGNDKFEAKTVENLVRTADAGYRYGIPTMGVTAVGKDMARDSKYFGLASRVCAENGANIVKTYYCDGFAKVVNACQVPIVIAGGKKLEEREALELCYKAINDGAMGVDMGRNVFQSKCPVAMIQAVSAVVHDGLTPEQGYEMYKDLSK
ncbi:3-hydroxy-5-phosphonooxypentane-2,4-dione thiolase [uncultured Rikenella sp.]|uniref:3-hydroxy-5-phosphonooxypentane-2,4-dione thiolase n=1 Tax=uncultured Rikenella sp. TaxID=368003 RepID=UPI0026179061|nr:3-hydroxy-5-phosphonooxypentane-2,4-dione thiolase [uncultured Rikenella sp.]